MFATANSKVNFYSRGLRAGLALGGGLFLANVAWADFTHTNKARLLAHAQTVYVTAQKRFGSETTNNIAAWEFARATFDRAEFSTNDTERATLAVQGIGACRDVLNRDPKSAAAHYYLGMNLGQLARTKTLGALKIVDEMEREFKAARSLDEHFDFAGPDRNLGLLYRDAPSIGSIGSRSRARHHLSRAAALAADFPENRLNLAESAVLWRDAKVFHRELSAVEALWSAARDRLSGPNWEMSWLDWTKRLEQLRVKAKEIARPRSAN